jgi:hypothetical protein
MRLGARVANWPLAWKVPLLAAGLLIGVAFVISQIVLNRLESDQENNLRHLTSAYLDGLSTAVLRSAIHADVWETFDALDRARDRYAGLKVRFAIVALPNGKVLAASDPLKFPVQSTVPVDIEARFPTDSTWTQHPAGRGSHALFARRAIRSGAFWRRLTFPSCFACASKWC